MFTRMLTKKDTQAIIKNLRKSGWPVKKESGGYACISDIDGSVIFTAMAGNAGYLVRLNPAWFSE